LAASRRSHLRLKRWPPESYRLGHIQPARNSATIDRSKGLIGQ
jgi:hypothetical protein